MTRQISCRNNIDWLTSHNRVNFSCSKLGSYPSDKVYPLYKNFNPRVGGGDVLDTLLIHSRDNKLTLMSEGDVADSLVDVMSAGISGVDHETVCELHGFSSLASQFTGDNYFAALKK